MENSCEPVNLAQFQWSATGVGFGELYFYTKEGDDKVYCDNEMMSKAFIKKVLCDMVDNAVMTVPNKRDIEDE